MFLSLLLCQCNLCDVLHWELIWINLALLLEAAGSICRKTLAEPPTGLWTKVPAPIARDHSIIHLVRGCIHLIFRPDCVFFFLPGLHYVLKECLCPVALVTTLVILCKRDLNMVNMLQQQIANVMVVQTHTKPAVAHSKQCLSSSLNTTKQSGV